ncbi:MAG: S8 family serine peptidase, partial [Bacteroidota bacterium]
MKKNTLRFILVSVFSLSMTINVIAQQRITPNEEQNLKISGGEKSSAQSTNMVRKATHIGNDKLEQLRKEFTERYTRWKNEAIAFAAQNKIPMTMELEDGGFAELQRIAEDGSPIYFRTFNSAAAESTRADYLNTGGGLGLNLNGNGIVAHVWDGGHARTTHQDYDGPGGTNRVTLMDTGTEGGVQLNFHAAHVTGTVCAEGVASFGAPYGTSKGMAWQSQVRGYMWNLDVAEATSQAGDGSGTGSFNNGYDMLVSNHSYGFQASLIPDSWFGQYGQDAVDWDGLMHAAPYYLMVVAAGNDGLDNSSNAAPLSGNSSFDKLSGHATAKNNLVVANGQDATINPDGSLNSGIRNTGSSEGPTDDFRIKPDIMGNGTDLASTGESSDSNYIALTGTSMASPNVAGSLILLQEHYDNLYGSWMRAATLKGLALHTADDTAAGGPDAETGWGYMNSKFAAETITTANGGGDAVISELTLNSGGTYQVNVQSNGTDPLMASISWTDPAGTLNSGTNSSTPALVNDLDVTLDNGSTFYPWRLTGVNSNANNARNDVDPYERIDISGASGTYTLTVNHSGAMTGSSQDFTLIITGGTIVGATPTVSFASTSSSQGEQDGCSFTDHNIAVNMTVGASASTDVDFTVNGGSTGTDGVDFQLMTSQLTFGIGSTASQNIVLRVFEDGFVEGDETAIIDFTVNANGGDAVANTAADTHTLTISNDDAVFSGTFDTNVLTEDFEDATGWTIQENDGDTEQWAIFNPFSHGSLVGNWAGSLTDLTLGGGTGTATPDNFLISPQFSIPAGAINTQFTFEIGTFSAAQEHYAVYFTTDISNTAAIIANSTLVEERNAISSSTETRSIGLSTLAGQTGYLVFRHYNTTGDSILMLDTIDVVVTENTAIQSAVNSGSPDQHDVFTSGTVHSSDASSGDVMLDLTNNNSFDYGCVDISVSRAGTGAQSYNGSVSPDFVMDKTFDISPTSTTGSGDTSITFYFTEAEVAGWETAVGGTIGVTRNTLVAARGSASSVTETSTLTVATFGGGVSLTGNFTGLDGTYYFGPLVAFTGPCAGTAKIWNGATWSGGTAPDATNTVTIDGNYDTAVHGNITGCTLNVNTGRTLTVRAGDFVQLNGNIVVDGSLIVEHTGSVVQTDASPSVINNGTINVLQTTPNLASRDFMILGSPMSGEMRNSVWNSAFLVLDATTA